jgi:hypothetical protein
VAQSAISNISIVPVPRGTSTSTGRKLVAIGTRGPLFDQRPTLTETSRPVCDDCGGFVSVKVRDGRGGLHTVTCPACTNHWALALTGR